jgi:hypothetical protein
MATTRFADSVRPAAGLGQGRRALGMRDLLPCRRRSRRNNDRLRTKTFALAGMGVLARGLVPRLCNIDREKRPEVISVPRWDHAQ